MFCVKGLKGPNTLQVQRPQTVIVIWHFDVILGLLLPLLIDLNLP